MATPGQRRPGAEKWFLALTFILNETAGLLKADVDVALLHGRNEQGGLLLLPGAGRAAVNGLGEGEVTRDVAWTQRRVTVSFRSSGEAIPSGYAADGPKASRK